MSSPQTPIDIHCSKLVDWLVQRRHCKKDWGENLGAIRRKIRAAIKDMPENEEIKQLLIGSKLEYFKSKRIVDILKTTEANSKNIFGFYSSQRMKDWQDIIYSYEKDNVYLAELATDLIRENTYEVPGINRVISKLEREKSDAENDKLNLLNKEQKFNAEYQRLAQSYGIEGINIGKELNEKHKNLSIVMEELINHSKELKPDIKYYREFARSTSKLDSEKLLDILSLVIEKGNITVYEWKHGQVPTTIVADEEQISASHHEQDNDEIDFGDDLPSSESSSGFVHVGQVDSGNNIEETFIQVGESVDTNHDERVACGDEAKLVLEYRQSRMQFINNLYELEAFFNQLLSIMAETSNQSSSFISDSGNRAPQYDSDRIEKVLSKISTVLNIMNKDKNKILFQMNDSKSFIESVIEKFSLKSKQASECAIKAELLQEKAKDLETQIKETKSHLLKSTESARELKGQVISSLRDLYSGRPINIMGCVV